MNHSIPFYSLSHYCVKLDTFGTVPRDHLYYNKARKIKCNLAIGVNYIYIFVQLNVCKMWKYSFPWLLYKKLQYVSGICQCICFVQKTKLWCNDMKVSMEIDTFIRAMSQLLQGLLWFAEKAIHQTTKQWTLAPKTIELHAWYQGPMKLEVVKSCRATLLLWEHLHVSKLSLGQAPQSN